MTTIAFGQYCNISFLGGSYASSPLRQPLNTSQTARLVSSNKPGILESKRSNPAKFGVSDSGSSFAVGRKQYTEARLSGNVESSGNHNNKYIAPASSSDRIYKLKNNAIGKPTILKEGVPLTYKNYSVNDVNNALSKVRGNGYIAPAKKGAIQNTYQTNLPQRGFLPPNPKSGVKYSAFLPRHLKKQIECQECDEIIDAPKRTNSLRRCPGRCGGDIALNNNPSKSLNIYTNCNDPCSN